MAPHSPGLEELIRRCGDRPRSKLKWLEAYERGIKDPANVFEKIKKKDNRREAGAKQRAPKGSKSKKSQPVAAPTSGSLLSASLNELDDFDFDFSAGLVATLAPVAGESTAGEGSTSEQQPAGALNVEPSPTLAWADGATLSMMFGGKNAAATPIVDAALLALAATSGPSATPPNGTVHDDLLEWFIGLEDPVEDEHTFSLHD